MPISTELILARHGEARCNVAGLVGGERTCTGLTGRGQDQVGRLASRLRSEDPIDALYTSTRRRCHETARVLSAALRLEIRTDNGLRGLDHGDADGRPWSTVKKAFGGRPQRHPQRPIADGAESWNAYLERTCGALAALVARHHGQRILVAAHGETIEASFVYFLGLPRDEREKPGFVTDHACLTRWQLHVNRFGHGAWMLANHNDAHHLTKPAESW